MKCRERVNLAAQLLLLHLLDCDPGQGSRLTGLSFFIPEMGIIMPAMQVVIRIKENV